VQEELGDYGPAPLDADSLWNGVSKFNHPQYCIPYECYDYLLDGLDMFFPFASLHNQEITLKDAMLKCLEPEHCKKSCGFPSNLHGFQTKEQALMEDVLRAFSAPSILCSTLKDELRKYGKDSRFFRPSSLKDYIRGLIICNTLNEYIADQLFTSPVFCKFASPGYDLSTLYQTLFEFGATFGLDIQQHDAHFPLAFAEIICLWRILRGSDYKETKSYYRDMYNGYTLVGGWLFNLIGMPSGHVCTTIDNCLCNILAILYCCWRLGWKLEEVRENLKFFCCGDDLVWSTNTELRPKILQVFYNELGMYPEFNSWEPDHISFVGTTPVFVNGCWRYYYNVEKLNSSAGVVRKSFTPIDKLAKLVGLYILSYYSEYAPVFKEHIWRHIQRHERFINVQDPNVAALMVYVCSDSAVTELYDRFECSRKLHSSLRIVV
jgi:hypothetical protein